MCMGKQYDDVIGCVRGHSSVRGSPLVMIGGFGIWEVRATRRVVVVVGAAVRVVGVARCRAVSRRRRMMRSKDAK
jgi:hypothetical protein